jgi:hypothetical protein
MKLAIACALVVAGVGTASAQSKLYGTGSNPSNTYVAPHVTKSGSSVDGHYRTAPNTTQLDNFGTRGNTNPYTGSTGKKWGQY